jgi:hypothetical protein
MKIENRLNNGIDTYAEVATLINCGFMTDNEAMEVLL